MGSQWIAISFQLIDTLPSLSIQCHTHTHTHIHTLTHTHTYTHTSHTHTHTTESVCLWVSGGDSALGTATLEVSLNNPILEAGFEIICSPTAEPGNVEAVRKTLQVCQVELHPFFVYSHDGKAGLSRQVITHGLDQLVYCSKRKAGL